MKTKKNKKKLVLNKVTIAQLETEEMNWVKSGCSGISTSSTVDFNCKESIICTL